MNKKRRVEMPKSDYTEVVTVEHMADCFAERL